VTGQQWKNDPALLLQQQTHDVYHGPRGVLRAGAPLDPGMAAFAASVTRSQNAPASYSNAAALQQQGITR